MQDIEQLTRYAQVQAQLYAHFWTPWALGFAFVNLVLLGLLCWCGYSAWRAASASQKAVSQMQRASQGSLLFQLFSEYSAEPMRAAMSGLFQWKDDHPTDFVEQFVTLFLKRDERAKEVDGHRRHIFRYFYNVRHFCEAGLIDPELIDDPILGNPVAAKLVLEILDPIQKAHSERIVHTLYPKDLFDYYRQRFHPRTAHG